MRLLNRCELKTSLLALILLISVGVNNTVEALGWSGFANITELQINDGVFYIQLEPAKVSNPTACAIFSGYHIFVKDTIDANQKDYKEYLSVVLTAYALNKQISIHSTQCYSNYPNGDGIQIQP